MVPLARWSKCMFPERGRKRCNWSFKNHRWMLSRRTLGLMLYDSFLEVQSVELFHLILKVSAVTGEGKDFIFHLDFRFSWSWIRPVDPRKQLRCRCLCSIQPLLIKWECFPMLLERRSFSCLFYPVLWQNRENRQALISYAQDITFLQVTFHLRYSCWWHYRCPFKALPKYLFPCMLMVHGLEGLLQPLPPPPPSHTSVWDMAGNLFPHTLSQALDTELELPLPPLWTYLKIFLMRMAHKQVKLGKSRSSWMWWMPLKWV